MRASRHGMGVSASILDAPMPGPHISRPNPLNGLNTETLPAPLDTAERTLVPSWGSAPGPVNLTQSIRQGGSLAAGSYLHTNGTSAFSGYRDAFISDAFTNNGVIWVEGAFAAIDSATLTNTGKIVSIDTDPVNQLRATIGVLTEKPLNNSGEIFAVSSARRATAVEVASSVTVDNSGLIAAWSEKNVATGIWADNQLFLVNRQNGRILAEGVGAMGVHIGRGSHPYSSDVSVTNAGVIEARSTSESIGSVGIYIEQLGVETVRIVNSGVIRGDYAIYSDDDGAATVTQKGKEHVTNASGGLIEGFVHLGRGDDVLLNSGTVRGTISMAEGNDLVDTRTGVIEGQTFLFWGDDQYLGGAGQDQVSGDNGDDRLEGGAGRDLLMGGGNNDVLIGGADADGLFGEYGDDRIVTQGADFVSGGAGRDRIELGDYAFARVTGGAGFDTLALAPGARRIDLRSVLDAKRVDGFEEIDLGGNKVIAVRAADVVALTGGSPQLRIQGQTSDQVELVGGWTQSGEVTIDSIVWRVFDLNGETVLVEREVPVSVVSAPSSGLTGLDPIASGAGAPMPGDPGGLGYTPLEIVLGDYSLTESVTVNPEELWYNEGLGMVLYTDASDVTITNYGALVTESGWSFPAGAVIGARSDPTVVNHGLISIVWYWDDNYTVAQESTAGLMHGLLQMGTVVNTGVVEALSLHGLAYGLYSCSFVENSGEIHAVSINGYATAVADPTRLTNTGLIRAEGALGAIGIATTWAWENAASNAGRIEAVSLGTATSIGIQFNLTMDGAFTNTGVIQADIAVQMLETIYRTGSAMALTNSGVLDGRVEMGSFADRVINNGLVTGAVSMGAGDDVFDGRGGVQAAEVDGGAGADILMGGLGDDRLFGGAGDDVLRGGAGNDRIDGGAGIDILEISGARANYRLMEDGQGFILKSADGSDRLTGVEFIRFSDGKMLDLLRLYEDDGPLVLPALEGDIGGKSDDGALVLPAMADKDALEPLVLPGDQAPLIRWSLPDDPLVIKGSMGPLLLDIDLNHPRSDPWA